LVKTVLVGFLLCVLLLDQKNQKSRMPDHLRAAFSPTLLGGYLSGCRSGVVLSVAYHPFYFRNKSIVGKINTQAGKGLNKRPEGSGCS